MAAPIDKIRNFSIIAHVDHGKSTLADRMLQDTGAVEERNMKEQTLDTMDIERERGITIKSVAVRLNYRADDGQDYILNLIDTPGHVDFSYEVSRSLAACEGALLLVDAAQGVEAQTLANAYKAIDQNLEIIPVINKIDLPSADIDSVQRQIEEVIGLPADDAVLASAKEGIGTHEILEAVVHRIHPPKGDREKPLRALIFDAIYDSYRGVIVYICVKEGRIRRGSRIKFMSNDAKYEVTELGVFSPQMTAVDTLEAGEVGYIICSIKTLKSTRIGDTVTEADNPATEQLPGYKEVKPVVFCGMYPALDTDYEDLRNALEKLQLNDSSFVYQPDNSDALGLGFRLGFLGLLHMEIIQERLEREFNLTLVTTVPNVAYQVYKAAGEQLTIENASKMPSPSVIERIEEPYIEAEIIVPTEYLSVVVDLCKKKRGIHVRIDYIDAKRCMAVYQMPLAEIVLDFYDKLKSYTRGYGYLEYRILGYQPGDLVKLDILLNGEAVDALSTIVHRERAEWVGRTLAAKLRTLIPRQQFEIAIQAAVGSRIIVRETIKALRKNVTAKCYGGDITRKRKLLEKQKEGKRRMKQIGSVEVPQEAFMALLRVNEDAESLTVTTTSIDKPRASNAKSPSPLWLRPLEFFLGPLNRRNLMVWLKLIALILVVRWIFIEPFRIPSGSMEPTLYGNGSFLNDDRVMVNKLAFGPRIPFTGRRLFDFGHPKRWEVVVFRSVEPAPPGSTAFQKALWRLWPKVLIKRVVGMPGERIHIRDGIVYANGKPLELPPTMPPVHYTSPGMEIFQPRPGQFVIDDGWRYGLRTEDEYALVPQGHYLVLGDNSGNSADGRRFGWLPEGHILGRAFGIWWPLSRRHDLTGFSHTWWGMLLLYGIPALLVLYELGVSFVSRSWPVHVDLPRLGLVEGDRLRVNCRAFGWRLPFSRRRVTPGREPQVGEVVLYRAPQGSRWEGATLLGRVVAQESQAPGFVVEEAETEEGSRDSVQREDLVGAVEAVWWPLRRRRPLGSTPPTTVADERA